MFDDFELVGIDELVDFVGDLFGMLDLDIDLDELDQPTIDLFGGGEHADLDPSLLWPTLDGPPLSPELASSEFGAMQLPNPFQPPDVVSSPIADGSRDAYLAELSVNTGVDLPF